MMAPSETLAGRPEFDENAIKVDELMFNKVNICLIGLDHEPTKFPKTNPWPTVEKKIKESSLVFVEYALPELEKLYNHPFFLFREYAQKECENNGIIDFSRRVSNICKDNNREIACADIANNAMYELFYYFGSKSILPCVLTGMTVYASTGPETIFLGSLLTTAISFIYSGLVLSQETNETGLFGREARKWEKYIIESEDARRLITAEGIKQEAQKRTPGSKITYISPPAHVSRVKMYLENEKNLMVRAKKNAWLHAPGLEKSIRTYKYSPLIDSWIQSSNIGLH